jgi:uncharacterized membrane protein
VGTADLKPLASGRVLHHGFLWQNGTMTDLAPVGGALCSVADSVNNRGQVVGRQGNCRPKSLGAMLWEGGSGYNLNSLITPSALFLTEAHSISDRGEIIALGVLPDGDQHVVLLEPIHP